MGGGIVGGPWATATVAAQTFQGRVRPCATPLMVLSDTACHAAEGKPSNLHLCPRGAWQDRRRGETVLAMLTIVCHGKKVRHRVWADCHARLAFTMAAFNLLIQWHG